MVMRRVTESKGSALVRQTDPVLYRTTGSPSGADLYQRGASSRIVRPGRFFSAFPLSTHFKQASFFPSLSGNSFGTVALGVGLAVALFVSRRNPIFLLGLLCVRCGGEALKPDEPPEFPDAGGVPSYPEKPLPDPGDLPEPREPAKGLPSTDDRKDPKKAPECIPDVCEGGEEVLQIDQIEETETGFRAPCLSFEEAVISESEGNFRGISELDFNQDGFKDFVLFEEDSSPAVFQGTGDSFESSSIPGVDLSSDTRDLLLQETEGENPRLLVVKENESEVYENPGASFVRRATLGPGKKGVFVGAHVYLCNDGPNYFYQNEGFNVYRERGYELWLDDPGECTDLLSFDLNEDGCQDLYVINNSNSGDRYATPNRLFLQDSVSGTCQGTFQSVEEELGLAGTSGGQDGEWVNYDVGAHALSIGVWGANLLCVENDEGTFTDQAGVLDIRDTGNSVVTTWGPAGTGLDDLNPWNFSGRWGEVDLLYRPIKNPEGMVEAYEIHPFPLSDPDSVTNTIGALWLHANEADEDGLWRIDLVRATDSEVLLHTNRTRWVTVCPEEEK